MTDSSVHNLFPTPVWVVDFDADIYEPLNRELIATLEAMIVDRPEVAAGATLQTDNNLQEFEEFADLLALVGGAFRGALQYLEVPADDFVFTGCWANLNPRGGINTPHTHPNNYLSGVYYVQTTEGEDSIFFPDPRPQASVISPPVAQESIYTGNEAVIDAKDGRLVIFPAWLLHGVPVNRSDRDRISFAFNVMFPSFTERMSRPKWSPTVRLRSRGTNGSG